MESNLREEIRRWLRQGKLGRVVYTCDQHLHAGSLPPEDRAEFLFWKATAHRDSGARGYGNAKACLKEAVPFARRAPNLKGKIMCLLSAIYADTLDTTALETLLTQFRKLVKAHPVEVRPLLPCVLFNVALAYEFTDRIREARQTYLEAIQVVTAHGLDPSLGELQEWLGSAIHNLGGLELKLGNLAAAWIAIEQTKDLRTDDWYQQKRLSRLAQFHLATGNLYDAQQFVTAALARDDVDDDTKADLYITWASILQRLGRYDEVREKAMIGLDYAVAVTHVTAIHEIHQILKELPPEKA